MATAAPASRGHGERMTATRRRARTQRPHRPPTRPRHTPRPRGQGPTGAPAHEHAEGPDPPSQPQDHEGASAPHQRRGQRQGSARQRPPRPAPERHDSCWSDRMRPVARSPSSLSLAMTRLPARRTPGPPRRSTQPHKAQYGPLQPQQRNHRRGRAAATGDYREGGATHPEGGKLTRRAHRSGCHDGDGIRRGLSNGSPRQRRAGQVAGSREAHRPRLGGPATLQRIHGHHRTNRCRVDSRPTPQANPLTHNQRGWMLHWAQARGLRVHPSTSA